MYPQAVTARPEAERLLMAASKKKPEEPEYVLRIEPTFVEREQKYKTLLTLETTKLFSNFRYDLSVQEEFDKKRFHFKVLGLRPPQLSLPAVGHARFVREFDSLRGTYDIAIEGLDGKVNSFSVKFTSKKMQLLKSPPSPFVDIIIDSSPIPSK